jgi:hypothetical protein
MSKLKPNGLRDIVVATFDAWYQHNEQGDQITMLKIA